MSSPLVDRFGRVHDYLRISVTDRCNLRCIYCMPEEGVEFVPHEHILSFEEITSVARVLAKAGVRKLRLTGGEPLVRKDLDQLIMMLSSVSGIEDIALTTNGILLARNAERLKRAGLNRVNISLDSLLEERYTQITRRGGIQRVLEGIEESWRVGLFPLKLNVVLMKGINDNEIPDFLNLTIDYPLQVRFIEYMPIGHSDSNWRGRYLSLDMVLKRCQELGLKVVPVRDAFGNGPVTSYKIVGARGSFGLIHPVSHHFCKECNRLRLTADGNIKACLYWADEWNVRRYIGDDQAVELLFRKALAEKPESHEMARMLEEQKLSRDPTWRRMSQIGG
ncbi:MAG: GTP 3',8-cyclase MoaA [Thermoactinomyces sp.]